MKNAISGNCGTIVSFRVVAEDAERLEKELGTFVAVDFCNLRRYHIYLRLMIDGIAGDVFSATTLPPESLQKTEKNAPTNIKVSRERYATKRSVIGEKIRKSSG